MEYQKLEYYLSQPRLNRFLIATGNSKSKAQKLYRINLRVAQSFYPVLNLFEIFFRNVVNYQVSSYFANPNWIVTEKNGFMNDPSLSPSRFFLKNSRHAPPSKLRLRISESQKLVLPQIRNPNDLSAHRAGAYLSVAKAVSPS